MGEIDLLKQVHQSNGSRDTLRGQIGSFAASQPSQPSVTCKCHARVTMLLGERLDHAFGVRSARRINTVSERTTVGNNVFAKCGLRPRLQKDGLFATNLTKFRCGPFHHRGSLCSKLLHYGRLALGKRRLNQRRMQALNWASCRPSKSIELAIFPRAGGKSNLRWFASARPHRFCRVTGPQ